MPAINHHIEPVYLDSPLPHLHPCCRVSALHPHLHLHLRSVAPTVLHDPIAPALSPRHHAPYVRTITCYDTHCSCCAPACHAYRNIIIRSGPQCVIFIVLVLLPQYAFASIRICIRLCVFASCLLVGCCLDRSPLPSLSHSLSLSLSFAGPLVCPILPMRSGEGARLAYQWRFVA